MRSLREALVAILLNIKSLPDRAWSSLVIVIGIGAVVAVLLSMMSLGAGMFRALEKAGDPQRVIITSLGAKNEAASSISVQSVAVILSAHGILKVEGGRPSADAEILTSVPIKTRNGGLNSRVQLRGFGPQGFSLRPELKIVEGRMPRPGVREMIVGLAAKEEFAGLAVGQVVIMPDGEWPIVGIFATGDALESNIIADAAPLMSALDNSDYTSVMLRLQPGENSFEELRRDLISNPSISVNVERQSDYYRRQISQYTGLFYGVTLVVGLIMALGAVFSCLNTLYSSVSKRTKEIATLRAVGFGGGAVAISVIAESLFLALIGSCAGAFVAWLFYDGKIDAYGPNVFHMAVTPELVVFGILSALVVASLGAIFPSIRAARLPIAVGLRAR